MDMAFLIDEQMPGAVFKAIVRHNRNSPYRVNILVVGGPGAPPKGTLDPDLLVWTEETGRILVSYDKHTLPGHFADHLAAGRHTPGIFLFKLRHLIADIVEFLTLAAHTSSPDEWVDRILYVE
jgi:hypothetical protein